MKKRILLTSLIAVILLGVLGTAIFLTSAETSAKVSLKLGTEKTYEVGDEVSVSLNFADVDFEVYGFTATLSWDSSKLQATKCSWNSANISGDASKGKPSNSDLQTADSATVVIAHSSDAFINEDEDVLTSGKIATFTFKVLDGASAENVIALTIDSMGKSSGDNHAAEVTATGVTVNVHIAEKSTVLFIADKAKGTGDGLTAANAMGNDADWQALLDSNDFVSVDNLMTGSSLWKAFYSLIETGGTIVVVDDVTVAYGSKGQDGSTSSGRTNNFYMKEEPNTTLNNVGNAKPITVTSLYDGVDYRSTNGAEFVLRSAKQNTRLHFFGDFTLENLDITCVLGEQTTTTNISFRGNVGVLGEGLNMRTTKDVTLKTYDDTLNSDALPRVYGGCMWGNTSTKAGRDNAIDLQVLSGSYYSVAGGNFPNGANGIKGNVDITIGEATIYDHVTAGFESSLNVNNAGYINGNVNITLNGTNLIGASGGAIFAATNTGSAGSAVTDDVALLTGDYNLVINPGTTITNYVYVTPNSTRTIFIGRVNGDATVTVNATDSTKPIEFKSINLGRQGLYSDSNTFTIAVNGDYWNSTDYGYWSTDYNKYTLSPSAFWAGALSNFVTGGHYNMTLDFSGMTYDEFWGHVNHAEDKTRSNSFDTPLYQNFYYKKDCGVTPTAKPSEVTATVYGLAEKAWGYTALIEPTSSPLASIAVKTAGTTTYTEGQTFDVTGFTFTGTREDSTTFDIAGTDTGLSVSPATALALTDKKVTVTYGGKTVDIAVTVNEKPVKSIAVKTNGTTTYTEGQTFDVTGFTFTVTYDDDSTKDVAGTAGGFTASPETALTTDTTAVTVTYGGKTVDVTVTVNAKKATAVVVKTEGKKDYMAGESFDPSGFTFTVTFEDSTTEDIAGSDTRLSVTPAGALTTDVTYVSVAYKTDTAATVNIAVTPAPKLLTAFTATGTYKTAYFSGEKFDPTGVTFTATMQDTATLSSADETVALADVVFTPALTEALKSSDTEVIASYTYAGVTKTAPLTISVSDPTLQSISIVSNPTKTEYWAGETMATAGLSVTADFDYDALDGAVDLSKLTIAPANGATLTSSNTELTVSYTVGGVTKSATVTLTVKTPTLQGITVTTSPSKTSYFKGEALSIEGLVVSADYDKDDLDGVVGNDALTFAPAAGAKLAASDTALTISYTVGSVTKMATVPLTVETIESAQINEDDVPATLSKLKDGDKVTSESLAKDGLTITVNGAKKVAPSADQITVNSPAGGTVNGDTTAVSITVTIGDSTFQFNVPVTVASSKGRSAADQMMDAWARWYIKNGKFPIFPED